MNIQLHLWFKNIQGLIVKFLKNSSKIDLLALFLYLRHLIC
jgi:hypothetical protein